MFHVNDGWRAGRSSCCNFVSKHARFVLHLNVVPLYVESAPLGEDSARARPELGDDAGPAAAGEARTDLG